MSLAQRTTSKPGNRIGGPRQPDPGDTSGLEVEDLGNGSTSQGSDEESPDGAVEPTQSSSAAAGSSTRAKTKKKADAPHIPARRSTRLVASVTAASRGPTGKEEASSPARRATKTQKANQRAVRGEAEEVLAVEDHDELLLRERSLEAMEQRLSSALRSELRKEQQAQLLAVPPTVPSSVTKALYSISALKEKAFDVWLSWMMPSEGQGCLHCSEHLL